MKKIFLLIPTLIFGNIGYTKEIPLDLIKLPAGFNIKVFAEVPSARSMALGENGTLFVTSNETGKLFAVLPKIEDGKRQVVELANSLSHPNGIAYYKGNLYIALLDKVIRYDDVENHLKDFPKPVIIFNKLPKEDYHSNRHLTIGPDEKIYVSVGAPCNVCTTDNPMHASILRINLDGSGFEIFASGVRDSLGLAFEPITNHLWFTDNGRDRLGDDIPPDELNIADQSGLNFGFPYCYGKNIPDTNFDPKAKCNGFIPSFYNFQAHSATLGLLFYSGNLFPLEYRDSLFVAMHGAWNRTHKTGYKIVNLQIKNGQVIAQHDFATGWLQGEEYWGRPVDFLTLPDGTLLISDDYLGAIYQIKYGCNIIPSS